MLSLPAPGPKGVVVVPHGCQVPRWRAPADDGEPVSGPSFRAAKDLAPLSRMSLASPDAITSRPVGRRPGCSKIPSTPRTRALRARCPDRAEPAEPKLRKAFSSGSGNQGPSVAKQQPSRCRPRQPCRDERQKAWSRHRPHSRHRRPRDAPSLICSGWTAISSLGCASVIWPLVWTDFWSAERGREPLPAGRAATAAREMGMPRVGNQSGQPWPAQLEVSPERASCPVSLSQAVRDRPASRPLATPAHCCQMRAQWAW